MVKHKKIFLCSNCDYRPPKWLGCCPSCNEWETITEQAPSSFANFQNTMVGNHIPLTSLADISDESLPRIQTGISEWDRVIGGGITPGSFLLITGDPGIGKSTLLLHVAHALAQTHTILYFSSEESLHQVKCRAQRLKCDNNKILFCDQAYLESIVANCTLYKPALIIIDSIQNCFSNQAPLIPGTVNQLREAAFTLMRLSKETGIAIVATGHITKDGIIAGPKMLEHMVDAVFYLQAEEQWNTRILRSVKNRFGSINEVGFFQMESDGLRQIININQWLVNDYSYAPGSALISYLEGSRPLLLELQALTIPTKFGVAQRIVSGVDPKQVALIAAILEKYLQIKLSTQDIFFKVSGGFKIKESSIDLGIALALLSSYFKKPLPTKSIAMAELSLTGLVKPIANISLHINEAATFGLEQCFVAKAQSVDARFNELICRFSNIYELLKLFPE